MAVLVMMLVAAVVSWLVCALVQSNARRWQLVDVPNGRSLHTAPTPRGGGLGIVVAFCVALAGFVLVGQLKWTEVVVLLPALVIALLGFIDDRRSLGVRLRLFIQLSCASAIVLLVDVDVPVAVPHGVVVAALVIYVAWLINLYNFMDGIDGIAATQAITVLAGASLIAWMQTGQAGPASWWLLVAACGGFLLWNWAPAKLFMGDSGSTFIGAVLATWSLGMDVVPLVCWLILMAVFIGDASYTLMRRAWHREPIWKPHRSHLYQRLAQRWGSHARVCAAVALVNIAWLLPLALAAAWCGSHGMPLLQFGALVVAYLPILAAAYNMT